MNCILWVSIFYDVWIKRLSFGSGSQCQLRIMEWLRGMYLKLSRRETPLSDHRNSRVWSKYSLLLLFLCPIPTWLQKQVKLWQVHKNAEILKSKFSSEDLRNQESKKVLGRWQRGGKEENDPLKWYVNLWLTSKLCMHG